MLFNLALRKTNEMTVGTFDGLYEDACKLAVFCVFGEVIPQLKAFVILIQYTKIVKIYGIK